LRAAFTLFIEHGIAGASIERIARRAGVGKASIYRRWTSRDALLAQAIEASRNENAAGYSIDAVERASPRDFLRLLLGVGEVLARPEMRRLMTRLIGTVPDHPHLLEVYRETYFAPRRRAIVGALRRVMAAGALPAETDLDLLVDMLAGALIYRVLFAPERDDTPEKIRAYVLRLIGAAGFDRSRLG
jgi:AcrR family transcriptional regulator